MRTSDLTTRPLSSRANRNLLLLGLLLAAALPAVWLRGRPAFVTRPSTAHAPTPPIANNPNAMPPTVANAPAIARAKAAYGKLPLFFIENRGQVAGPAAFYLPARDKTVYFTPQGLTIAFTQTKTQERAPRFLPAAFHADESRQQWTLKLDFVGANPHAKLRGQDPTPTAISYFKGARDQWQTELRTFSTLVYEDLWPGIDLVYSGAGQRLKYSFLVKPGADPGQIKLAYRGASGVKLNRAGELEITTPLGGFTDERPVSFQQLNGRQVKIETAYNLEPSQSAIRNPQSAIKYGFHVAEYDRSQPLVIDPAMLLYAGYLGGSSDDYGNSIAVNNTGEVFITGTTYSNQATFPTGPGYNNSFNGESDVFVAKVNAAGTVLVYLTYLGGSRDDSGTGIAIDASGNAYITGNRAANSVGFPLLGAVSATSGFVAKLNATGTSLAYVSGLESVFGFNRDTYANGVAVDAQGNAYIAGSWFQGFDYRHIAFVLRCNASGGATHLNYFYGTDDDCGYGVAVDGAGNVYLVGTTHSSDAFSSLGPDLSYNGDQDGFIAKFDANLSPIYSSYLGGSDKDGALAVAADAAGNAYVTGYTASTNFPTTAGLGTTFNGGYDAFVARISADGTSVQYAGYLGGSDDDSGTGIAVDGAGNAHVTGTTWSADFPVVAALDSSFNGVTDAFVATLNAVGNTLVYSSYHGGVSEEEGHALAVDGAGNVYLAGLTLSPAPAFPVTGGALDTTYNGATDAFIAKLGGLTPSNTMSGGNVTPPLPPGSPAITFNNVSTPGTTTVAAIPPSSAGTLPGGFSLEGLNVAYEIATTSSFTGPIVLTFDVPASVTESQFSALRILHNESGVLVDRTILPPSNPAPNYSTRKISALVTSLSPFVLAGVLTAPAVTLSASTTTPLLGQSVTLTAAIRNGGAPITSGNVTFKENTTVLAGPLSLNANGQASFSTANLGAGAHTIKAEYSGDGALFLPNQGSVTLSVGCPALTVAPAALPNGQLGAAYNQPLSVAPSGSYTFALASGALPPGLSLNATTGVISGTATTAGNYSLAIKATGYGGSCSVTQAYSLLITGTCTALTVNPATLPAGTLGAAYQQTFTTTGGSGPYTFSVASGALPAGLTLAASTGMLSGVPTTSGSFAFTIRVVGAGGCTGQRTYVLTIGCATITLNPTTLPASKRNIAYSQTLTASPAASYTFSLLTGSLPPGFTLNGTTGVLSGTSTITGSYNFTLRARTASGCQGTRAYTLSIVNSALLAARDFDGDGRSELVIWQANHATGELEWFIQHSSDGALRRESWGLAGDYPVAADYDGDGRADLAVYRATEGRWLLKLSSKDKTQEQRFGALGATPVPADYDGDGMADLAVWRDGVWEIAWSSDGLAQILSYGVTGDMPVPADYDGDGRADLAVYERAVSRWRIHQSSTGLELTQLFGAAADIPRPGDYDGDGKADLAVWRPQTGEWHIQHSTTQTNRVHAWDAGYMSDHNASQPGDYNGDGQLDIAFWRSLTQSWHIWEVVKGTTLPTPTKPVR